MPIDCLNKQTLFICIYLRLRSDKNAFLLKAPLKISEKCHFCLILIELQNSVTFDVIYLQCVQINEIHVLTIIKITI